MSDRDEQAVTEDAVLPFPDASTAREAVRVFSRPKTEREEIVLIYKRLLVSGSEIIHNVLKNLLENFDNLQVDAQKVAFDLMYHIIRQNIDISRLILPLAVLVGNRDEQIQEKVLELLCSVGPLAKPAEDLAMGCLRNNSAPIRMAGARILYAIGGACSRSITRQLRSVAQRYLSEREFCALLLATVRRITGVSGVPAQSGGAAPAVPAAEGALPAQPAPDSGSSSDVLARLLSGKTLLVIEDDEVIRSSVQELLTHKLGMNVLTADNGQQGVQMVQERQQQKQPLDYIVLDLKMPDMNGVQVMKTLREKSLAAETAIVIVSAVADERILKVLYDLGAQEYIRKPFRMNQLIRALIASNRTNITA